MQKMGIAANERCFDLLLPLSRIQPYRIAVSRSGEAFSALWTVIVLLPVFAAISRMLIP
jgi:hypothetical protein